MPAASENFSATGLGSGDILLRMVGAFERLGWTLKYAGPDRVVGYTPRSLTRYSQEMDIAAGEGEFVVTSRMIYNEAFDLFKRNLKNIRALAEAWEAVKAETDPGKLAGWGATLEKLRQETVVAAEKEVREAEEVEKVMKVSGSNHYLTYTIMGLNVLWYLAFVVSGGDWISPSGADLIKWGANYGPLTLSGDWWRLVSAMFAHGGLIHLLANMYALYMVGIYLEPMLGKGRFALAYFCTGITASLASLWWHNPPVPSVGASGAIFGMYGVFLALLSTSLIPAAMRKGLLQSIGIFVIYNLAYGMKSGVDNAAHVGGLVGGLVFGYGYYLGLKPGATRSMGTIVGAGLTLLTILGAGYYIYANRVGADQRKAVQDEVRAAGYRDSGRYYELYGQIIEQQNVAVNAMNEKTDSEEVDVRKLKSVAMPAWMKAEELAREMAALNVAPGAAARARLMIDFLGLQKHKTELVIRLFGEKDNSAGEELEGLNKRIDSAIAELNKPETP